MGMPPLRRWWEDRTAGLAWRWEVDSGFRHSASLLVTALTLSLVVLCLFVTLVVAHGIVPQWFGLAPGGANPGMGQGNIATFPVAPLHPLPTNPAMAPVAVATSALGSPEQPTPTATTASPTPAVTATPTGGGTPSCPALTQAPTLGGRSVQDGMVPAPLQGGCPAQLIIHAATHPNSVVAVTLTFGNLDPIGCTLTLSGTTDGAGDAALSFTVPGNHCFYGTIITSGTITVGGDNSANVNFAAQA